MPASRLLAVALAGLAVASPSFGLPGWSLSLATNVALTAVSLVGLNLIFGVAGMLAFGQAALMVLPAYGAGVLHAAGLGWPAAMVGGLAAAVLVARLVADLFVRLPGVYLAVGTLGFGYVVEGLARAFPAWTGGASGLVFAGGEALSRPAWYALSVAALLLALGSYGWLLRGAGWRRLRTLRHDELVAATMGIDVVRARVRAFTWGSCYPIAAGLLLAFYVGVVVPENAGVERSLEQIGMVIMGGPALLLGPVAGAALVGWLFFVAGYAARFELLIYGSVFLLAVMYARHGLAGWLVAPWRRLARRLDALPPTPPAVAPYAAAAAHPHAEPPVARDASGERARPALPVLQVADLAKRYGGVVALEGIGFTVGAGEIFALIGPNGAGKSTLFNVISGIVPPSAGRIRLAGQDIDGVPIHRRAALIGRSFQVARLVPDLTAAENVLVRLDHVRAEASEADRQAMARAQLEAFGLAALADRRVSDLGIGQHKLIDLARASVGDPKLILLDEPAVGLHADELGHLQDLLRRLQALGRAVVIVEHNFSFLTGIAGDGLVLDSGRPVAIGPVRTILASERVRDAYFGALA